MTSQSAATANGGQSEQLRHYARAARDYQWRFMERAAELGTIWFTAWNKYRREQGPDEWRDALITGIDILQRIEQQPEWFVVGEWDDARFARPISLTQAGLVALKDRAPWDMEPYRGGLVEPGWVAIPAPAAGGQEVPQ